MTIHILATGTSRGIGAAIADAFGRDDVFFQGHGTRDTAERLGADLDRPGAADRLWADAMDRLHGQVDVLINNAGVFEEAPLDLDDAAWLAAWERTLRINLTATAELCRRAVKHWQESKRGGRIVNVASRAAYRGDSPAHWHYAASKGGMVALTKTIARGYAADGILAFAVCPGFVATGMAEGVDGVAADIPLGRVATPEEVANAVRYLAMDAPPSMTGASLDINGASHVR